MSQQIFTFSNEFNHQMDNNHSITGDEIPVYQNAGMLSEMFNHIPVNNLTDSTLHMLLPNHHQALSLSLSSTLEAAAASKSEDFRSFYSSSSNQNRSISQDFSYFNTHYHQFNQFKTQLFRSSPAAGAVAVAASASSSSSFNILRTSRYAIAAQELLEEFCSVGRGQFKKNNKLISGGGGGVSGGGGGGGAVKDDNNSFDSLSASDRIEHQRRKVKLLAMLEEVDRRYNHYCEQMQTVVNSFDMVMGHGAALPYTSLAQKAMSRHFRCLKDAIAAQLKLSCERLGDKNAEGNSSSRLTKGETPRLRLLEQSLRQQRAFHSMGMMEQEAWRPQRGLPERSVNLLRAWLFEHFLHPYPSDADKHLLARQTGLSRNQVSNWFINARVRLWKPMVEEMYQQESNEIENQENEKNQENEEEEINKKDKSSKSNNNENNFTIARTTSQTPIQSLNANANANAGVLGPHRLRSNNVYENDPSSLLLSPSTSTAAFSVVATCQQSIGGDDDVIRFGTNQTGDVSLTLGLRHAGNVSHKESSSFCVRDFGGF